jgi:hypothetical protein
MNKVSNLNFHLKPTRIEFCVKLLALMLDDFDIFTIIDSFGFLIKL